MKREISAGGIVFRKEGKKTFVLLIKDYNGKWSLPKGLVEKGEKHEQTALREVGEETGLNDIDLIAPLGQIKYFYKITGEQSEPVKSSGETIFKIVYFFLMETKQKELKPQWEIQGAEWFDINDVLEKSDYKNQIELLKKAIEKIKEIAKRKSLGDFS